jgi:hypothetical protein
MGLGWLRKALSVTQQVTAVMSLLGIAPGWLTKTLSLVNRADQLHREKADKRRMVIEELIAGGLSETEARTMLELALKVVKA